MPTKLSLAGRADIRRILIVKWSAMGDVVMSTAIMEDICRAFPKAVVDLNTLPANAGLFVHDPRFRQIIVFDVRGKQGRLATALAWIRRVRAERYDLIVDLQRSDRIRAFLILLRLTGNAPRFLIGNRGGFPYRVRPDISAKTAPALKMMRSLLEAAGIPYATSRPVLHAGPEQVAHVRQLLDTHGLESGRFAVFLPGSQAAGWLKRWGVERYVELAGLLHASGIHKVVVIGGPDEVEDCRAIAEGADFVVNLNGQLGLLEIAPLCEHAACIVANDTGTAHIAAAADRPMLVICGPTNPERVKPIGDKVSAIQLDLPCRNCYAKDCLIEEHHACMKRLTPRFVAAEVRRMLEGGENEMVLDVPVIRV